MPLHGRQVPAVDGARTAHPLRPRSLPHRRHPPDPPEFEEGFRRLESIGFPLERDLDESWRHFQGWRVDYEPIVDALTRLILPPPAPWFVPRPELGEATWPSCATGRPTRRRGRSSVRSSKTFKTPSRRESKRS